MMRELLVEVLITLAESNPYLLGAAALIGSFWLLRSVIHKARIFTEQLTIQVRESKGEIHEWAETLRKLKRELTTWKPDP
jgi:hypothetical protein